MKRFLILLCTLAMCLGLCGCADLFDGNYVSVKPHEEETDQQQTGNITAADYQQLYDAICALGESGTENAIISVPLYDQEKIQTDMDRAIAAVKRRNPICAYAVDTITYELGTSGGQSAIALSIQYIHNRAEIYKIQQAESEELCKAYVYKELSACSSGIVMLVSDYTELDYQQLVADYADNNPDLVMEVPQVAVNVYPETGRTRVVEVKFIYQNSREVLRTMQNVVQPLFEAALQSIQGGMTHDEQYARLYAYLMGRFDYKIDTSITPAYSLLSYGVGDQKAIATVYAAMCGKAGLECWVVTGTRDGQSCYWNIVKVEDTYYHLDLLRCSQEEGMYRRMGDADMVGYVWDYQAYPECGPEIVPDETIPGETVPGESAPEETLPQDSTLGETTPEEIIE